MAGAHRARAVASFVLSEFLEEDVVKNESEDELEGLAALFLENERKPAVRIRGYVEEVVANLSDDRFLSPRKQPFSTVSTQFDAGWKSRGTKPTENGFLPIEHETTQPTQPTWNGWSQ